MGGGSTIGSGTAGNQRLTKNDGATTIITITTRPYHTCAKITRSLGRISKLVFSGPWEKARTPRDASTMETSRRRPYQSQHFRCVWRVCTSPLSWLGETRLENSDPGGVLSRHPCGILSPVCYLITRVSSYHPVCYVFPRELSNQPRVILSPGVLSYQPCDSTIVLYGSNDNSGNEKTSNNRTRRSIKQKNPQEKRP